MSVTQILPRHQHRTEAQADLGPHRNLELGSERHLQYGVPVKEVLRPEARRLLDRCDLLPKVRE